MHKKLVQTRKASLEQNKSISTLNEQLDIVACGDKEVTPIQAKKNPKVF